jgi:hypothetical protein
LRQFRSLSADPAVPDHGSFARDRCRRLGRAKEFATTTKDFSSYFWRAAEIEFVAAPTCGRCVG